MPAGHSGGSMTAGQVMRAPPVERLGAALAAEPPGQLERAPPVQLQAFRTALAVAEADRQGGAGGAAGGVAAGQGPPPHAEGPSWVAEAAAGASLGVGQIDLPTSVMLMQQAAGVIRGLHEELQRSKGQVGGPGRHCLL